MLFIFFLPPISYLIICNVHIDLGDVRQWAGVDEGHREEVVQ